MKLTEVLNEVDFKWCVCKNRFYLVDITGANLANIEAEHFEINDNLPTVICDRLERYFDDYIYDDILDHLGYGKNECYTWLDLLDKIYQDNYYSRELKILLFYLAYPNLLDIDDIRKATIGGN